MQIRSWLMLVGLFLVSPVHASGDIHLLVDHWEYHISGDININGDRQDLQDDLGVQAHDHTLYSLAWITGPGWWKPDLAASYTPIKASGQRTITSSPALNLPLSSAGGGTTEIIGDANLKDIDVTARYPFSYKALSVWGGVTVKRLYGTVTLQDASNPQGVVQNVEQTFPMAHFASSLTLDRWLSLSAMGNFVRYHENEAFEYRIGASVGVYGPLGVNAGWLRKVYHIHNDNEQINANLSGWIIGAFLALP